MDSQRRSERATWLLFAMLAVAVAALVISLLSLGKESNDNATQIAKTKALASAQAAALRCEQAYDDAQYARSSFLQRYLLPRNDAQTRLTLATIKHDPPAVVDRLRVEFAKANAAYAQASAQNPLPLPPKLSCPPTQTLMTPQPSTPAISAPASTSSSSRSVVPGPTVTRTVPVTVRPSGSTSTVTVTRTAPGSTRTVTRTTHATATVTTTRGVCLPVLCP